MTWDKSLQRCKIYLDSGGNRLVVQFFQKYGLFRLRNLLLYLGFVKTHNLPIIECERLEAIYNADDATCQLAISSK